MILQISVPGEPVSLAPAIDRLKETMKCEHISLELIMISLTVF